MKMKEKKNFPTVRARDLKFWRNGMEESRADNRST